MSCLRKRFARVSLGVVFVQAGGANSTQYYWIFMLLNNSVWL